VHIGKVRCGRVCTITSSLSFELQATDMVAWYSYYNVSLETGSEHCNTWKALEVEYVVYYVVIVPE